MFDMPLTPEQERRIAETKRFFEDWLAQPLEKCTADLIHFGILDDEGQLSSRYGGPGKMTPSQQDLEDAAAAAPR